MKAYNFGGLPGGVLIVVAVILGICWTFATCAIVTEPKKSAAENFEGCEALEGFRLLAKRPSISYVQDEFMFLCYAQVCVSEETESPRVVSLDEVPCELLKVRLQWVRDSQEKEGN